MKEFININAKLTYLNRDIDTLKKTRVIVAALLIADTADIDETLVGKKQELEL